jgi:dTDP-4-dehydrorhamnose reductase
MRILLTGREGQVARSLLEKAPGFPGLELIPAGRPEADLAEPGSIARVIRTVAPDLVINAAAYTAVDLAEDEPDVAFRINAEAAGEAATAARELGSGIIQISTDYVFDGQAAEPYDEGAPTNPVSIYGRSKLAGEEAVRAANPEHLILRTAWVYSPFGRNFVKTMVAAARDRDELKVVADQQGSPTSAPDLAGAILAIAAGWPAAGGRTYHLAGTGSASWFDLAEEAMNHCRRLGLPAAEVRAIRTADWPTKAVRPPFAVLDSSAIHRGLGIHLPDWRLSVAATVECLAAGQC